jgi:hypothetical protein
MYTSPTQPPGKSQYDPDSAPDEGYNCGPTTVVNVLQFHKDRVFPIEQTRALATSSHGRGTSTSERKTMLDRRGIASSVRHLSPDQVKALLNGRRSFDIALLMSKIPLAIRVRPFSGSHSVEAVAKGVSQGSPGIWVNNPDYHRDRDQRARYFYPDRYWIPAFLALGGWCVVPDKDKVITTRTAYRKSCTTTAGVNLRSGPGTQYTRLRTVASGTHFTSIQLETAGGAYSANGKTRRDWLSFSFNGRVVWVARAYVKEV